MFGRGGDTGLHSAYLSYSVYSIYFRTPFRKLWFSEEKKAKVCFVYRYIVYRYIYMYIYSIATSLHICLYIYISLSRQGQGTERRLWEADMCRPTSAENWFFKGWDAREYKIISKEENLSKSRLRSEILSPQDYRSKPRESLLWNCLYKKWETFSFRVRCSCFPKNA